LESEGDRPLVRPRHRWEDNNIVDLREVVLQGVDLAHLAWDRDWWQSLANMKIKCMI
jgi:hypothetical protein